MISLVEVDYCLSENGHSTKSGKTIIKIGK